MAASPAKIMSIFGGSRRHGRWRVPEKTSVLALCGRCVIDLRDATADGEDIRISVTSVFASVLLLVPEGADVLPSGTAVLASAACLVPQSDAEATLPPVRVESMTVLGKLRIQVISDEEAGIEKKHWWRRRKAQPQPSVLPAQPAEQPAPTLQVQTPPAEQYAPVPRDPYPEREPRYEVVTQRQAPEPQDDFFSDPAPSPAASDDDLLTASTSSAFDDDELFTATTSRSLAEDAAFTAPPAESASGADADTDDDMLNATTNAAPSERDEELIASE